MDFEPNESQRALCETVRAFGRSLKGALAERDAQALFDREAWRRCAEFGIQGLPIPSELGGAYAKERRQFGEPIGRFDRAADTLVDAKVALEASRPLLFRVEARKDQGRDAVLVAAAAKLFVSEAHVHEALAAVQRSTASTATPPSSR